MSSYPNNNFLSVLFLLASIIGLISPGTQAGIEITYIYNDALGTPVAGADEQGNVKWRAHYQPYGEELLGERQLFGVRAGYTGHRADPETGLTYMVARYYSPTLGRFMGVDPSGVDASNIHSFNRYAYANNNPYRFIDPDGQIVETAVDIVSLGLSIALFKQDPNIVNGLGVAFDGLATAVPFLPGGFGIIKSIGKAADVAGDAKKTTSGIRVTQHGVQQKINRQVRSVDELDAIKNPLDVGPVKIDKLGRPSQRSVGRKAEVARNPETGDIVSVNPTSSKKADRLMQRQQDQ